MCPVLNQIGGEGLSKGHASYLRLASDQHALSHELRHLRLLARPPARRNGHCQHRACSRNHLILTTRVSWLPVALRLSDLHDPVKYHPRSLHHRSTRYGVARVLIPACPGTITIHIRTPQDQRAHSRTQLRVLINNQCQNRSSTRIAQLVQPVAWR